MKKIKKKQKKEGLFSVSAKITPYYTQSIIFLQVLWGLQNAAKENIMTSKVGVSMIEEKRQARRFQGRFGIISKDPEGLNFGFITDLSRDGAYVETEKLLPIGTPFEFVLSNGSVQTSISSRVVRTRDSFFDGGNSGMGVHFETLRGLGRNVRDDLILCMMNQGFQSMWEKTA